MDEAARAFAAAARVGHLATASAKGVPHVVPVCFVLFGDRIYIALDEKPKRVPPERLRRVRNILENPEVQLLIDHYDEDWRLLRFVQISGRAALVEPGAAGHREAVEALRAKYAQYREMALEALPVIAISFARTIGWSASGG